MGYFDQITAVLPVAAYATDGDGYISSYNAEAARLWGQEHPMGSRRWFGAWRMRASGGEILPSDASPLAVAFKEGRETCHSEVILERPDGHRTCIRVHIRLEIEAGIVIGSLVLLIEQPSDAKEDVRRDQLAAIVASSEDVIVSKTLEGVVTSWNAGASRILGYTAEEMIGQPITRIIPEELLNEETEILEKVRRGERVEHFVTERLTKDGRRVILSITVSPLKDRAGNIVGASKVARDVTERKHASDMQRRLFDELDHRVKNTLATVLAFAGLSRRRAVSDPDSFAESFADRIQALARTHNLLVQGKMLGSDLACLVSKEINHGAPDEGRATIAGANITVDARTAGQLGLVLHELASNARRYGALSSRGGTLRVEWTTDESSGGLVLDWTEAGVSGVSAPIDTGLGLSLIKSTTESLGGALRLDFNPDGLTCRISLPRLEPAKLEAVLPPQRSDHAE